jgi:single-stranded-DNA-specific exonuclease
MLDMAALATVADMVELTDENRTIATLGMQLLRRTNRPGLRSLYEKGRIQGRELTEVDIGFTIGSHINAASRLDKPRLAYKLLTTRSYKTGQKLAGKLHAVYRKRKNRTKRLHRQVKERVAASGDDEVIVAGSPEWKPALLGPVAHRVLDQTGKPTFLWGESEGGRKGSARASDHNVVQMLKAVADDHLTRFGGHGLAGGFQLQADSSNFGDALADVVDECKKDVPDESVAPVTVEVSQINWKLYQALRDLGPFGVGHSQPQFVLENVDIAESYNFGSNGGHVRLELADDESLEVVSFFAPSAIKDVQAGDTVTLITTLEKTTFGFTKKLQLKVVSVE